MTDWLMDHVQLSYNQATSYLKHWYFHCPSFSGDFQCETGSKTRWRGCTERRVLSIGAQRTAFHLFLGDFFVFKPPNTMGWRFGTSQGSNTMFKDMWNTVNISFSFQSRFASKKLELSKIWFLPWGRRCFIPVVSMASGRHTLRMKMSSPSKWWTTSPTRTLFFSQLLELGWRWWRAWHCITVQSKEWHSLAFENE